MEMPCCAVKGILLSMAQANYHQGGGGGGALLNSGNFVHIKP